MNKEVIGAMVGTSTTAIGTAMQPERILSIASLILTIIGSLITIGMAVAAWWKKAKADGKITKDEIKEGAEIIGDGIKQIQQTLDDKKEEER